MITIAAQAPAGEWEPRRAPIENTNTPRAQQLRRLLSVAGEVRPVAVLGALV